MYQQILFSKQSRTKIPKKPKEETDSGMPGQEGIIDTNVYHVNSGLDHVMK